MSDVLLLGTVMVIGVMGGLASLLPAFATLLGLRLEEWRPPLRYATAAALLIVGLVAGVHAFQAERRTTDRDPESQPAITPADVSSGASMTVTATTMTAPPAADPPIDRTATAAVPPKTQPAARRPARRLTDESGASVPQLVAATNGLAPAYSVTGTIRETIERSPELADLYTVHLTLSATITRHDDIVAAFGLRSRGGGFQVEAARAQALDRLTEEFRARLREVP